MADNEIITDFQPVNRVPAGFQPTDEITTDFTPVEPIVDPVPILRQAPPEGTITQVWNSTMELFKDPQKESAKAVQALVDSESLDISPSSAYRLQDTISRGVEINPVAARKRSTLMERVNQSWEIGGKQNQIGELGYRFIMDGDPRWLNAIEKIGMPGPEDIFVSEGRLEDAVRSAAKLLPMTVDIAKEAGWKGVTVGTGFGLIAMLAGQPELVPAMAMLGLKIGGAEGIYEGALRKEAGLALSEIINFEDEEGNKIDPSIARATAFGIGIINAGLEVAEVRILMDTIPGINKLFSRAILETVTSKTVKGKLFNLAKLYGKTVAKETAVEVAQESNNIVFEELGKKINNYLKGTNINAADANQVLQRLYETGKESAQGFAVIAAPGIMVQVGGVVIESQVEREKAKTTAIGRTKEVLTSFGMNEETAQIEAEKIVDKTVKLQETFAREEVAESDIDVATQITELDKPTMDFILDLGIEPTDIKNLVEAPVSPEVAEGIAEVVPEEKPPTEAKRIVSDEIYEAAQERIKEKLKGLKVGIDPTILPDLVITGAYHIETGFRTFSEWSKQMIGRYGDKIKPHLRNIWKQSNDYLKAQLPAKRVKPLIREITGQKRPEELRDLRFAFIKAARASRIAFRAGNKEGVLVEHERMLAILQRAKERRLSNAQIAKDIKFLKKLPKKAKGKIALDYQKKIRDLLEGVDLARPTEATIERLKGLQDFIEREGVPLGISYPEINQLKRLAITPVRDMSEDARKFLIDTARKLYDVGKLKRKFELSKEGRELADNLDSLVESTENQDPKLSGKPEKTKIDLAKVTATRVNMETLHTFRVADNIDGNKDFQGANAEMIKEQLDSELIAKDESQRRLKEILEKTQTKIQELGIEEIPEDMMQRINVVLMVEQDARGQASALMDKNGMEKVPVLNGTERAIINILREGVGAKTEAITKTYEKRENEIFPKVDNYFPIKYEKELSIAPPDAINQNRYRTRQVEAGFVKERLPGVEDTPRDDLFGILEDAIMDQEWYLQMQPTIDRHSLLTNTPEYKDAAGQLATSWWKDQIDIVSRKGWSATARSGAWGPILRQTRLNLNQAILGFKASTIIMQPFAIFDATSFATSRWGILAGKDVVVEFSKAWINPKAAKEFIKQSPSLRQRRGGEIALEETLDKVKGKKNVWDKAIRAAMSGIQFADIITAAGVEKGLLKVLNKHNIPNVEKEADFLMNVVSGSSEISLRPHVLSRGEGARTWLTFQTFFLNRWGIITNDLIRTGLIKGEWGRKYTALLGLTIFIAGGLAEDEAREILYEFISGKESRAKHESYWDKIFKYLPRQIPVFGGLFDQWGKIEPPVIGVLARGGAGIEKIYEGKPIAGFLKLAEGILAIGFGVPGTAQTFDVLDRLLEDVKKEEAKKKKTKRR